MGDVELTISRGLRLHFDFSVGYEGRYFHARLRNKDKVILHLLNNAKWKVSFPDDDYLDVSKITLEAIDLEENIVKALNALMRIRGIRSNEVERLRKLPLCKACRELILKALVEA
jgi:hypothetical protein